MSGPDFGFDPIEGAPAGRRAARRRQSARRRRFAVLGAIVLVIAVGLGAVLALSGGEEKKPKAAAPPPSSTTTSTTVPDPGVKVHTIATTKAGKLDVHAEPNPASAKVATLEAATAYRAPTTLLLDDQRQATPDGWLPVTVPFVKPNNTPGWVNRQNVQMSQTTYEIHVQLWTHNLQLVKDGKVILRSKVIVGTKDTPTPTGRFYVTDPVNCNTQQVAGYPVGQCDGAYGAFAIGTSALSEKLDSFSGTIPQIALHGTNLPATELGKDLSNGCIRMPNDVILELAKIKPLIGTPVIVTLLDSSVRPGPATGTGGAV
jgi:lipoprotein-anchoring transpeptidase ErfK/SrfK